MTNGLMDVATGMPDTQLPDGTPVDVRNRFVGLVEPRLRGGRAGAGRVPRPAPVGRQRAP